MRASHVHVQCVLSNVSMCLCLPCSRFLHLLFIIRSTAPSPPSHLRIFVCFNSGTCYSSWLDIACISTILLNLQSLIPRVIVQSGIWCFYFFYLRILHFFIIYYSFGCVCMCLFCPSISCIWWLRCMYCIETTQSK